MNAVGESRTKAHIVGAWQMLRSPAMRKVWPYLRGSMTLLICGFLLALGSSSLEAGRILLLLAALQAMTGAAPALPSVVKPYLPGDAVTLLGAVAILTLLRCALEWTRRVVSATAQRDVVSAIRQDTMRGVFQQPLDFFTDRRAGEVVYIINSQVSRFSTFVPLLSDVAASILTLGTVGWLMVRVEPRLTGLLLILAGAVWVVTRPFYWKLQETGFRQAAASTEAAARFQDAVRGIKLVKSCRTEAWEADRCAREADRVSDLQVTATIERESASQIAAIGGVVAIVLVALAGTRIGVKGAVLFALLVLAVRLLPEVGKIREAWMSLAGTWGHLVQVAGLLTAHTPFELPECLATLDMTAEKVSGVKTRLLGPKHRMEFHSMGFRYRGGPAVLHQVDLTCYPGEAVAVVGLTGSGKSTLLDVMAGLRPGAGQTHYSWDTTTAYATQEPILMYGTVGENVRYGQSQTCVPYIPILAIPSDTQVGEAGSKLSGGQRQLVALARVASQDADVLLLDEPTSSMDAETEAKVMQWILSQRVKDYSTRKQIILVATHRLHAIKDFDRILVLHGGRIVQAGTHDQLVRQDGLYVRLWKLQEVTK